MGRIYVSDLNRSIKFLFIFIYIMIYFLQTKTFEFDSMFVLLQL